MFTCTTSVPCGAGFMLASLHNWLITQITAAITIIISATINNWFGIAVEIGSIYIFVSYIKALFEPINRTIDNIEIVQEAIVSINKIYDILDEKQYLEDFESGQKLTNIKGKIEFKNVWFAY